MEFLLNSTGSTFIYDVPKELRAKVGYDSITISGQAEKLDGTFAEAGAYFTLKADGLLKVIDSFDFNGRLFISASGEALQLAVDANADFAGLGTLKANGTFIYDQSGLLASIDLTNDINIVNLVKISGLLALKINTASHSRALPTGTKEIIQGNTTLITFKGTAAFVGMMSFDTSGKLVYKGGIFAANFVANTSFIGLNINAVVFFSTEGEYKFTIKADVDYEKNYSFKKTKWGQTFKGSGGIKFDAGVELEISYLDSNGTAMFGDQNYVFKLKGKAEMNGKFKTPKLSVTIDLYVGSKTFTLPSTTLAINKSAEITYQSDTGLLKVSTRIFGKAVSFQIGSAGFKPPKALPAKVARIEGGVLIVHVGEQANQRNYYKNTNAETVVIKKQGAGIAVDVLGKVTVLYGSFNSIQIDAGTGLDVVDIRSDVQAQVYITGAETVYHDGAGFADITTTSGNDQIIVTGASSTIDAGSGDDTIIIKGEGDHIITPNAGNDTIISELDSGSVKLIFKDGFGQDKLAGPGLLHLDFSQINSSIKLEYDPYLKNQFSVTVADGSSLSLSPADLPLINQIDLGRADDVVVLTGDVQDIGSGYITNLSTKITDAGGNDQLYFVQVNNEVVEFDNHKISIGSSRIIDFDANIEQFTLFGQGVTYQSNQQFNGINSYSKASALGSSILHANSNFNLGGTKVKIVANSVEIRSTASAAQWTIEANHSVQFNGTSLTAIQADISLVQSNAAGSVGINGDLITSQGKISLVAAGSITATSQADIYAAQTVTISSSAGAVQQDDGSKIRTDNQNITIEAKQNINIAHIDAGNGSVTLTSHNGGMFDSGDSHIDIKAKAVTFSSFTGFGTDANAIDTVLDTVQGSVNHGTINIHENDALQITGSGLTVANAGNILLLNKSADISVDGVVQIAGNGMLRIAALAGSIRVNSNIITHNQEISLQGAQDIQQKANTQISSVNGSIDLWAKSGSIIQQDNALITTESAAGNVRTSGG